MKIGNEMKTVNFKAEYMDETEAKHVLSLDSYGEGELTEDGKWVLLEPQGRRASRTVAPALRLLVSVYAVTETALLCAARSACHRLLFLGGIAFVPFVKVTVCLRATDCI
eukprot:7278263-Prymnesium_polylepis.1